MGNGFVDRKILRTLKGALFTLTLLVTLAIAPSVFAATYYVDNLSGLDTNNGTSTSTPWKTIAHVNAQSFNPGDSILFRSGDTWREQLRVPSSGSAGNPITFGSYGTGANPIINGSNVVSTWTATNSGSVDPTVSNVWQAPYTHQPKAVYFNGTRGTLAANTSSITAQYNWYWASNVLYVWSPTGGNPSLYYTTPGIEAGALPTSWSGLIYNNSRSYITINGIDVVHSEYMGILAIPYSTNMSNIVIKNSTVSYSFDGGIVSPPESPYTVSNVTVDTCTVHHNNQGGSGSDHEGISLQQVTTLEVKNSVVHDNVKEGIDIKRGSTGGSIHDNTVYANGSGNGGPGIYIDASSNLDIYNNLIRDNNGPASSQQSAGIQVSNETNTWGTNSIRIFYNLIYGNDSAIDFWIKSGVTTGISNIGIFNNVFYANTNQGGIWFDSSLTNNLSGTNAIENNIFWLNDTSRQEIRDDTTAHQATGLFTIANNLFRTGVHTDTVGTTPVQTSNVGFVNASEGNFTLQSTSPAIGAGVNVGLTQDYAGNPVPAVPNIGAYETKGPTGRPQPPTGLTVR